MNALRSFSNRFAKDMSLFFAHINALPFGRML